MTYDQIVQGRRDSQYELQNEGRMVNAGLKPEQDTARIAERYTWLYSDEALDAVGEPADAEGERVRRALLSGCIEFRSAVQQDRLATRYANATVAVGDEPVPFHTAQAQLAIEPDWWANHDAGEWLREQWRQGWTPDVEDVLAGIGGGRWLSGDALLERWGATGVRE